MPYVTSIEQMGIEQGRQAERRVLALKMLQEGADLNFVVKVTGFMVEQIQQFQVEAQHEQ